ncbi:hypothetical protein FBUS_07851 [Fasciolopsis buskii]|uniref:G-protein coupled receptors family 1 profile domain-containing protein n=1 Tax=Fasciolopsis buskii TaxID=27845 RepID=A0A8E0VKN4_9TREM|nr:hypothetical protein FBUS_07851 [Fasciolopsis buski]
MQSNATGIVYNSILMPPISPTIQAVLSTLMSVGIVVNLYTAFALHQTKINSSLTKLLLYQQNLLDSLFAVLTISLICTDNYRPASNTIPVSSIVCHLFQSGVLSRIVRIMMVCNTVCQSADRFWAIVYPKTYRAYKNYYIALCSLLIPLYSVLSSVTRIAKVTMIDGSCLKHDLSVNKYTLCIVESILRYGIPMFLLILLNVLVIRRLCKQQQIQLVGSLTEQITHDGSADVTGRIENTGHILISIQRHIFVNTFFLAIELTVIEVVAIVLTILNLCNIVSYGVDSISRVYYLVTVVLLSGLNPCAEIFTIRMLRNTVMMHWHLFGSCCRKYEVNS